MTAIPTPAATAPMLPTATATPAVPLRPAAQTNIGLPGAVLGSTLLAALVTATVTAVRASAATRRDRYAEATAHLAAWTEFPYRVRRRTSDSAGSMSALVEHGHLLQEAAARHRGWVAGESEAISTLYDAWLVAIQHRCFPWLQQAWDAKHVTKPAEMNLNGFGPGSADDALRAVERAIAYRFGWRRRLPDAVIAWRLRKRGLFPPG